MAGVAASEDGLVEIEERLAEEFLEQAYEALRDSASPGQLYSAAARAPSADAVVRVTARVLARQRRLRFSRTSILFSALAVEATANQFLAKHLPRADFSAVDKMSPADKLVIGSRLVGAVSHLSRGTEPIQTIDRLMAMRNRLVHAKVRTLTVTHDSHLNLAGYGDYNPGAAAEFVLAAARVAVDLGQSLTSEGSKPEDAANLLIAARAIVDERVAVLRLGREARDELPPLDGPEPIDVIGRAWSKRAAGWVAGLAPGT